MRVEEGKLLLQSAEDAIELALRGRKFSSLSTEEVEKISLEAQNSYENPS